MCRFSQPPPSAPFLAENGPITEVICETSNSHKNWNAASCFGRTRHLPTSNSSLHRLRGGECRWKSDERFHGHCLITYLWYAQANLQQVLLRDSWERTHVIRTCMHNTWALMRAVYMISESTKSRSNTKRWPYAQAHKHWDGSSSSCVPGPIENKGPALLLIYLELTLSFQLHVIMVFSCRTIKLAEDSTYSCAISRFLDGLLAPWYWWTQNNTFQLLTRASGPRGLFDARDKSWNAWSRIITHLLSRAEIVAGAGGGFNRAIFRCGVCFCITKSGNQFATHKVRSATDSTTGTTHYIVT